MLTWWWRWIQRQRMTRVIRVHPQGNINVWMLFSRDFTALFHGSYLFKLKKRTFCRLEPSMSPFYPSSYSTSLKVQMIIMKLTSICLTPNLTVYSTDWKPGLSVVWIFSHEQSCSKVNWTGWYSASWHRCHTTTCFMIQSSELFLLQLEWQLINVGNNSCNWL